MQQSEEIRRLVERWLRALGSGDAKAVLARLSEHPATLLIGTDPNEWWPADTASSRRALRAVWARQIEDGDVQCEARVDVLIEHLQGIASAADGCPGFA
jgi:ketosteroid isomerase-like protein